MGSGKGAGQGISPPCPPKRALLPSPPTCVSSSASLSLRARASASALSSYCRTLATPTRRENSANTRSVICGGCFGGGGGRRRVGYVFGGVGWGAVKDAGPPSRRVPKAPVPRGTRCSVRALPPTSFTRASSFASCPSRRAASRPSGSASRAFEAAEADSLAASDWGEIKGGGAGV